MNIAFAASALQVQLMVNMSAVFQDYQLLSHNKLFESSYSYGGQTLQEISQVNSDSIELVAELHYFEWSQLASTPHKLTLMTKIEQQRLW